MKDPKLNPAPIETRENYCEDCDRLITHPTQHNCQNGFVEVAEL